MRQLLCSLLALAAMIAHLGQPTWGYFVKHTTISGMVIDSGYTQEIDLSDTVAELKEKLAEKYQVSKDLFHVRWNNNEMPDDFELKQIRDSSNYDLHLVYDFPLIEVVKPDGGCVIVGSEKEDTIGQFKDKIAKRLNIPREMQRIMGSSRELKDDEKLADGLSVERTSYVVSVQWKSARVRVKFQSGEIVTFEFEHSEKVADLKRKIAQAKGIAQERQSLLLKGDGELEDGTLLVSSGLTSRSILTLVERDADELDIIYVRLASKRLLTFEVSRARDTVANLKEMISRAEGIAKENQHLFLFKGNEMANARLLSDYVTKSESVVDLLLCSVSQGGQGTVAGHHIHWEPMGEDVGLRFLLNIRPNDTVASVKQAINLLNNDSLPHSITLRMFSGNKELEDERPMLEHVLSNGSIIQLEESRNDGPEMINVRLPSGRLITFELDLASKVKELKQLIEHEMGRDMTSRKRLFYGDQELSDEKSLYDCNIKSGSTLNLIVAKPGDY